MSHTQSDVSLKKVDETFYPPPTHPQDMQGNGSAPQSRHHAATRKCAEGGARCVYLMLAPRRRGSCLVSLLRAYLYMCVQRGAWRAAPARPACAREGARGVWCHAAMGLAECHGTSWWHFYRPPRHCSASRTTLGVRRQLLDDQPHRLRAREDIDVKSSGGELKGLGRSRRGRSRGG